MNNQELEDRLINFSVDIINIVEQLPKSITGLTLGKQIVRSGTSFSLNYGEARGAESKRDFIHKLQICLKELRETSITLKIIAKSNLSPNTESIESAINENNELIGIFVTTIKKLKLNTQK